MTQELIGRAVGSYRFTKKAEDIPRYCQNAQCPYRQAKRFHVSKMVKIGEIYFCETCASHITDTPKPF